ncbi:aspartate aminotransferase family protein [Pantoea sp. FN0305]|uniref:aspartate aminotransferase family protein n=1 Tax=Pantoea sp. FN0305 TaxID=3418559 RepID=UPI003CEAA96A
MSSVIYKNLNQPPVEVTGGEGVWLHDRQGKRWLDTCGGVAVSSLGHCHPRIIAAMQRESGALSWAHAGSFTTPAAEALADWLVMRSGGMAKAQFLSGGSEAMELALKVAWQYQHERGKFQKTHIIARRQNYHGSTFNMLAISGNSQRRGIYDPLLPAVTFVSPCYAFRDQRGEETDKAYTDRLAQELDEHITALGSDNVCAFVAETVIGSTAGAVPPVVGYFRKIQQVCQRHDVLLILDEVMAGMGRTGSYFAYQDDGIVPDMVAVGKGLAAGYQPISALLINANIHQAIADGTGVLANGQTHVNHPFACAIALEVQRTLEEEQLLPRVVRAGEFFRTMLKESLSGLDYVGDIRGRGLFCGVEFVTDRYSMNPLAPHQQFAARLKTAGLEQGLLLYPGTGTVDGINGQHILFAPPFIAGDDELAQMVERFTAILSTLKMK